MKPSKKKTFKSNKKNKIRDIPHDSIINRDKNIEEIKKILYDPRSDTFKPEQDHYKPVRIGDSLSSNYIEY